MVLMQSPMQIISPVDQKQYTICIHCSRAINAAALAAGKGPVTTPFAAAVQQTQPV
jgi:hypothetical protein